MTSQSRFGSIVLFELLHGDFRTVVIVRVNAAQRRIGKFLKNSHYVFYVPRGVRRNSAFRSQSGVERVLKCLLFKFNALSNFS